MTSASCAVITRLIQRVVAFAAVVMMFAVSSHAQSASIGGTVMMDGSEKPLANAEVLIASLKRSTRSDSAGNFLLSGLPAGRHEFVVRLVGYESSTAEVNLNSTQKFEADVLLRPTTTRLARVDVTGKVNSAWTIKLKEFEERRSTGIGKFLTEAEFANEGGRSLGALLAMKIAGVRVVQQNGRNWLASLRGGLTSCPQSDCPTMERVPPACYMQVVVNGVVRYNGSAGQPIFDANELNTQDVIGVEFYTTATTPLQYNATRGRYMGACGTIIIWTKGGG